MPLRVLCGRACAANLHPKTAFEGGTKLFGSDGEATIDGAHPTDLGFMRIARTFARILRPLV